MPANCLHKSLPTKEICQAYSQGLKVKEIAEMYNCSHNSVRNHLKKGRVWPDSQTVGANKQPKDLRKKNPTRQRDIINYIMNSREDVFTIESIAEQFGCTHAEASRTLSSIANKNLGLERAIRGTYKKAANIQRSVEEQAFKTEQATWPAPAYSLPKRQGADFIQISQAIIDLAEQCGGMDNLVARATDLRRQGYGA